MQLVRRIKCLCRFIYMLTATNDQYVRYLRKKGISVGENVNFRNPLSITIDFTRPLLISIGNNIDINSNFSILTHDFGTFVFRNLYDDFVNSSGKVTIDDNVVIGRNVTLLKGASIGRDSIVAYGSVVTKPMPPGSVIAGCPAKVVSTIDEYYRKRKTKSVQEAIDYGCEIITKYEREPVLDDFLEEWSLFVNKYEYDNNPNLRNYIDLRLKGYVDINDYLKRPKVFGDFTSFLSAINKDYNSRNLSNRNE